MEIKIRVIGDEYTNRYGDQKIFGCSKFQESGSSTPP